jgi:hypothetical protein
VTASPAHKRGIYTLPMLTGHIFYRRVMLKVFTGPLAIFEESRGWSGCDTACLYKFLKCFKRVGPHMDLSIHHFSYKFPFFSVEEARREARHHTLGARS